MESSAAMEGSVGGPWGFSETKSRGSEEEEDLPHTVPMLNLLPFQSGANVTQRAGVTRFTSALPPHQACRVAVEQAPQNIPLSFTLPTAFVDNEGAGRASLSTHHHFNY